jgi:3-oxoadipate enol-lactonase
VLVHGFPFSSEMWKGQVQMLREKNLRIITYDLRGHGNSGAGDGQYTIELFVDDLIALIDRLDITKTILCGFSMGGYVALRAIERNPERFGALMLCDTMSAADSNEARLRRAASIKVIKEKGVGPFAEGFLKAVFAPQSFSARAGVVDEMRKIIMSNPAIGICGALLAMAGRTDTTEALGKIVVPTLVIVGEHDNVTPLAAAQTMKDKIPNSRLQVIGGAAHVSNMENPSAFNECMASFLDGVPGPG